MDRGGVLGGVAALTVGVAAGSHLAYPYWLHDIRTIRFDVKRKRILNKQLASGLTYVDILDNTLKKYAEKRFIEFAGTSYTYGDIDKLANRFANFAQQRGLKLGDTVAIFMYNEPTFVWSIIGLSRLGVKCALVNYNVRRDSLLHCLTIVDARLVLVGEVFSDRLHTALSEIEEHLTSNGIDVWSVCSDVHSNTLFKFALPVGREIRRSADVAIPREIRSGSDDMFLYMYTSGTSGGKLKAPRMLHWRFMSKHITNIYYQQIQHNDRVYICLPMYHGTGFIHGLCNIISVGATMVLVPKFSVTRFWRDVVEYEATVLIHVGEICRYLLNSPENPLERQHKLRVAYGNGLTREISTKFRERFKIPNIFEFYGVTEGVFVSINKDNTAGAVGRLSPLLKKRYGLEFIECDTETGEPVRDPNGRCIPVKLGQPGLLVMPIVGEYAGYQGDPISTAKRILRDVLHTGDRYFNSGDLLLLDRNYYMYFVDRLGDTFRWKGENVATTEVMERIAVFPGISEVLVYGVKVEGHDGRAGMAAIVLKPDSVLDFKGFYNYMTTHLPKYACPLFLRVEPSLDITGSYKYKKSDFVKEGFNPTTIESPLYYMDISQGTYLPLEMENFAKIMVGNARL